MAKFENHIWYRVKIAEVGQYGQVLIFFTDYGNFAYVGERDLVAGVEGIPAGEEKDVYLLEAAAYDVSFQSEENIIESAEREVFQVSVEGKCLKSEHAEKDVAAGEVKVEVAESESLRFLGGELVDIGVQQQTTIKEVDDYEPTLENTGARDSKVSSDICEGDSCLAIWDEDGVLYRATLKTWLPGGIKAEVHFIDYDNMAEVGIENLFRDYSCVPEEVLLSDLVDFNVGAHIRLLLASRIY